MQRLAARERVGVRSRAQVARDAAPVAELLVVLVDVALVRVRVRVGVRVRVRVGVGVRVRVRVRVKAFSIISLRTRSRSLLVHSLADPKAGSSVARLLRSAVVAEPLVRVG